ncbi:TonB-dependent receptor [Brevundimonas intermedia]|uniref:TonB-dependent receptor n=1 Tax=Brevundimonas intermedia TaxID=74315 RepID=UPI0032086AF3
MAQTAPAASEPSATQVDEVVVTGIRSALRSALNTKRNADVMVDAINAEDIADFPDANLAESLQRLPGVSIDRDNGEGRSISVRGLGGDFTRVRLNGLETLSTAGSNDSGSSPNRSRGFDFSTFASELFSSLRVQKTASAETDEGALGATVDLISGRPFNFPERRIGLSIQDAYYDYGGKHNPRVAALISDRWDFGRFGEFGLLGSIAYNKRETQSDSYERSPGQSDYLYRGATFQGTSTPAGREYQGFARPTGTTIPNVTNPIALGYLTGSDPAAYALLHGPTGRGSLVRIPALPNMNHREIEQERLGVTLSAQWRPTERTTISVDTLYSKFDSSSINYQLVPVGLNRNNTSGVIPNATNYSYNTARPGPPSAGTAASNQGSATQRRGLYSSCTAQGVLTSSDGNRIRDAIDCGQSLNGGALVPGYQFSFNPNNLDTYEYYNNPNSPGYINDPYGLAMRGAFIGRPATRVLEAALSPDGTQAEYLKLGRVDMRSAADAGIFTTEFQQASINLEHAFSDTFRMTALYGASKSTNESQGLLAEFNRMDSGDGTPGNDFFVYDARGDGDFPTLNFGFDTADPNSWDFVKGFSGLRHYQRYTGNTYISGRVDFAYDWNPNFTLKFGGTRRVFEFDTYQSERLVGDTVNPSFLEGPNPTTVQAMGQLVSWGEGLDVPEGMPTSFWAPNLTAFQEHYGFTCDCINEYGDWRLSKLRSPANTFGVKEIDTSLYAQGDFNFDFLGRELRGNVGLRYAYTNLRSAGLTTTARSVSASNDYEDWLPSMNVAYELFDDFYVRFGAAKVMARPLLGNLAPSITGFSVPGAAGASTGGSITLGNPNLKPFRATNLDLSAEWYFNPDALLAVALFHKEIDSFPQTLVGENRLSEILSPDQIAQLREAFLDVPGAVPSPTLAAQRAYLDQDLPFAVRQFRDAPGGTLQGVEISYQQAFTFLPWYFRNLGAQANYTHIESELEYILTPQPLTTGKGPFLGASPDAFNFTLYYETDKFSARVSTSYRAGYQTTYPIATGTCDPGVCDSPLINDFAGSEATTNVDFSSSYKLNDNVSLTFEALNLTDEANSRWAYSDEPVVSSYGKNGRQYFFGARMTF